MKLNPRHTFDTFNVERKNELAYALMFAVGKRPQSYNPVFLYGPFGSGKTHLLHAVGNTLKTKILYLTGEQLYSNIQEAIRKDTFSQLKKECLSNETVMIDDVDFFVNKPAAQRAVVDLIKVLYSRKKQILLTSELAPRHLPVITKHLLSHCNWGMMCDL